MTLACPHCGGRGNFTGYFNMRRRCQTCNLDFDRNPGSYIGGIGLNTVFSFVVLAVAVVLTFVVTGDDTPLWQLLVVPLAVAVIVPLIFFPFSKSIWIAFEYLAAPPRAENYKTSPEEIAAAQAASDGTKNDSAARDGAQNDGERSIGTSPTTNGAQTKPLPDER